MRQSTVTSLIVASALALSASAAIAQKYPTRQSEDSYSYRALQRPDGNFGERRDVPYGQGGTAGTHETGANVGPGRAGMNHAN